MKVDPEVFGMMWRRGDTLKAIAADLDISVTSVRKYRNSLGLPLRAKKGSKLSEKQVIECRDKGMTIKETARKYGVSITTVQKANLRYGVTWGSGNAGRKAIIPDSDEFRKMWLNGTHSDDIAILFGASGAGVRSAAGRYGFPPRKRGGPRKAT